MKNKSNITIVAITAMLSFGVLSMGRAKIKKHYKQRIEHKQKCFGEKDKCAHDYKSHHKAE